MQRHRVCGLQRRIHPVPGVRLGSKGQARAQDTRRGASNYSLELEKLKSLKTALHTLPLIKEASWAYQHDKDGVPGPDFLESIRGCLPAAEYLHVPAVFPDLQLVLFLLYYLYAW